MINNFLLEEREVDVNKLNIKIKFLQKQIK